MNQDMLRQVMSEHREDCLDNREFGFWLYLMTDAIIFALLFATYVSMFRNTANGPEPIHLFDLKHVFFETACLLISSVTFGFAWLAAMNKKRPSVILWLIITIVFGVAFVFLEVVEFLEMIQEGAGPQASGYLSSFFTLVATHG
ncbi:cytochrome c oxidase subunit 3, partial [Endozoicomonas sp. SESOKO2]